MTEKSRMALAEKILELVIVSSKHASTIDDEEKSRNLLTESSKLWGDLFLIMKGIQEVGE